MRPNPYKRTTAAIAGLFQLAVVGVVPVADALLEAAAFDAEVHIEVESRTPCAPAHDHLACQLCRTLGRVGPSAAIVAIAASPYVVRLHSRAHPPSPGGSAESAPLGARAPPLA